MSERLYGSWQVPPPGATCTRWWVAVLVALGVVASSAGADEVPWAEWTDLAARSDAVVHGTCTSTTSAWDESGRIIVTTAHLRTKRAFKGTDGRPLTVKVLGGTVDGVRMDASHGATLSEGEEAVLFLQRSRFGSYYVVAGGETGKLAVQAGDPLAEPKILDGLSMDDFANGLREGRGARR